MNILFITERLDPTNGWGMYASSLVRALRERGVRVTVLSSDSSSEGPRLPWVHAGRSAWFVAGIRLRLWLAFHRFDLIHVAAEHYARLFESFGATPFVVTVHGTYVDPAAQGPLWAASLLERALRRASRIIAVSRFTAERARPEVRARVVVIPNGVDPGIVHEPFESPSSHGRPLIIGVGAVKPRKGYDRLIKGFVRFLPDHPDAELVIIGDDEDRETSDDLRRLADELGISTSVRITGKISRPQLIGWYRACDAFALTTVDDGGFEGFGLVYAEANAFGKPCVGSRGTAAEEVIVEGENGFLTDADHQEDVAKALESAMYLSREKIEEHVKEMDWRSRAAEYLRIYKS
jgi:glycosyltransferase involved in cell wall biosynthesis